MVAEYKHGSNIKATERFKVLTSCILLLLVGGYKTWMQHKSHVNLRLV